MGNGNWETEMDFDEFGWWGRAAESSSGKVEHSSTTTIKALECFLSFDLILVCEASHNEFLAKQVKCQGG